MKVWNYNETLEGRDDLIGRGVKEMDVYSIRHRGLRLFFERGQSRGLPPQRVEKIRRILSAVGDAESLDELAAMPGW